MKPGFVHQVVAALVGSCVACGGMLESDPGPPSPPDSGVSPAQDAEPSQEAGSAPDGTRDGAPADGPSPAPADAAGSTDAPETTDAREVTDASDDGAPVDASPSDGGLPSTAPCLTGGNVLSLEGDNGCFWFAGTQTDDSTSQWATEAEDYYAAYDGALIEVTPHQNLPNGPGWFLNFDTWGMQQAMQTGVTYDALAANGATTMVSYARSCSVTLGQFRVDDFSATGGEGGIGTLVSFTAAFSLTCDGSPGALRGCVHYEQ